MFLAISIRSKVHVLIDVVSQLFNGLSTFNYRTDVDAVVDEIARKEALITASKTDQVRKLIGSIL